MAYIYTLEGRVFLGTLQAQYLVVMGSIPPCTRTFEPHMTNAFPTQIFSAAWLLSEGDKPGVLPQTGEQQIIEAVVQLVQHD
jgi:hypothetical protein